MGFPDGVCGQKEKSLAEISGFVVIVDQNDVTIFSDSSFSLLGKQPLSESIKYLNRPGIY